MPKMHQLHLASGEPVSTDDHHFVGNSNLAIADIVVLVIYFCFILFVGLWSSRQNRGSVGGYFLAGRNMHWVPIGASLFASNIGSVHFVGLAGSGAAVGISNVLYEINAIFFVLILGWLFLPVYIASGITTMPEYMRKRFGRQRIRIYLAVLSLLLYVFTKISADLFAGALFIEQAIGWNLYAATILILAIAAIFTITGGLTAVIWTDFIQTIIMLGGALALMGLGFIRVNGIEGMRYKYERSVSNDTLYSNTTCGYPREDYFHLMRDAQTGDIPWPGIFGVFINSIWYWCADQVIVQRTLAAKNYTHAKLGTILCGYLKFLPMFIIVFPGMMSRIIFPDEIACIDPDKCEAICGNRAGCTNIAYPLLVLELMPDGARGLMLAVMLSALMSSLTSIFNSSSTVFTIDIWKKARKNAKDTELMIVSRLCVIVLVGVSMAWLPVIQASAGSQLFNYIQQITGYLTPPIGAVYILAIFTHHVNELGAFCSMVIGLGIGVIRFVLEFVYPAPICGELDDRPNIIKNFHFLYFAIFIFLLTGALALLISCMTKPIDIKHIQRLTYWTRHSTQPRIDIDDDSVINLDAAISDKSPAPNGDLSRGNQPLSDVSSLMSHVSISKAKSCWRAFSRWVCGIEKMGDDVVQLTAEEQAALDAKVNSIEETKRDNLIGNVNCVFLLVLTVFFWGFFA